MPRTPRRSGRELVALTKHGFAVVRVRGSHHVLRHADGRATVVPIHGKETIGPGLLARILRDCKLSHADLDRRS